MTDRGQLVLVAAAIAALALVPVAAAYLQFGYAPASAAVDGDHAGRVSHALDRIVDDAAESATGAPWRAREAAVEGMQDALAQRVDAVEASRLREGVAVSVSYNASLARDVTCPSGSGRAFGACDVLGGVVVQERIGETVVVAVAFDVRVSTPTGTLWFSRVLRPA